MRKRQNGECNVRKFGQFLLYELWCTGIQSRCFYKWLWILNLSNWISVVDIPSQILLTILSSIDHSCERTFAVSLAEKKVRGYSIDSVSFVWYLHIHLNIYHYEILHTPNKVLLFLAMYAYKFGAIILTFSFGIREAHTSCMGKIVAMAIKLLPVCLTCICIKKK